MTATDAWDAETGTYSLTLKQSVPDTPGPLNTIEQFGEFEQHFSTVFNMYRVGTCLNCVEI